MTFIKNNSIKIRTKEVNMHGSVNYQSAQPGGNPVTRPMHSNAILLDDLSKVKKGESNQVIPDNIRE